MVVIYGHGNDIKMYELNHIYEHTPAAGSGGTETPPSAAEAGAEPTGKSRDLLGCCISDWSEVAPHSGAARPGLLPGAGVREHSKPKLNLTFNIIIINNNNINVNKNYY
jgi:hypothetical protein